MTFMHNHFNRICRAPDGAGGGAAPAAAAPAAAAAPTAWTDTITDTGTRDFAVNKGYNKHDIGTAAPIILQQYHNLEKLVGAEKAGNTVIKPNWDGDDDAAVASRNQFFDSIGRPKEGKDYDLGIPAGAKANETVTNWSRDTFHKLGLSAKQATALSQEYQALEAKLDSDKQAADVQRFAAEDGILKKEWGAAYGDKIAKASAVAKGLGVKAEHIDALQSVAGYGEIMKMFASLADKVGEDTLINGDTNGNGGGKLTPAEAKAELQKLSRDKDWMAAFMDKAHPNHKAALERKAFLTAAEVAGQAS